MKFGVHSPYGKNYKRGKFGMVYLSFGTVNGSHFIFSTSSFFPYFWPTKVSKNVCHTFTVVKILDDGSCPSCKLTEAEKKPPHQSGIIKLYIKLYSLKKYVAI